MKKVIKKSGRNKIFYSMILILVFLTMLVPVTAFANSNFSQVKYVSPYETVGVAFNTGSDNKLTVVAIGTVSYGNPGNVTIKLQRRNAFGIYVTESTIQIPTNGSSNTILRDYPVSTNTNYRFAYSCGGTSGIDVAYVSMGIGLWH